MIHSSFLQSTGGVLKRGVEDGESSTSSKKKKKSKNKKHKKSPGKSNDSHISPEHSSPNSHNKMPQMRTSAVNTNGQKLLCSNTKVRRISAWVDSVDHSYTPSEQGTCVSSPTHSLDASNDFFPFTPLREPSETNSRPAKQPNKRDVYTDKSNNNMNNHSRHPSSFSQKGSIASDISATGEKKREKRKNSSSTSGNHHAPFTPLSPRSSVTGVNSAKTNPRQELPNAATAYPAQSIEAMQLDSQLPLEDFVNNHNNVGQDRTQFADDSEIAMEIDNYEELADQIKLEVSLVTLIKRQISNSEKIRWFTMHSVLKFLQSYFGAQTHLSLDVQAKLYLNHGTRGKRWLQPSLCSMLPKTCFTRWG